MEMKVTLHGFKEGEAELRLAVSRFDSVVEQALQQFGDETLTHFKVTIASNGFGLPTKSNGNPPLWETGRYVESWKVFVAEKKVSLHPQGWHSAAMSNADLAELLEFGSESLGMAPRPHIRPLGMWMESRTNDLGRRIAHGLFSRRA